LPRLAFFPVYTGPLISAKEENTKRRGRNEVEASGNSDNARTEQNANHEEESTDLHGKQDQNTSPLGPVNTQRTEEARVLLEKSAQLFASVNAQ